MVLDRIRNLGNAFQSRAAARQIDLAPRMRGHVGVIAEFQNPDRPKETHRKDRNLFIQRSLGCLEACREVRWEDPLQPGRALPIGLHKRHGIESQRLLVDVGFNMIPNGGARLLRDYLFPSAGISTGGETGASFADGPMVSTFAQATADGGATISRALARAINAIGVGTNPAAGSLALSGTGLGLGMGVDPENKWNWYHLAGGTQGAPTVDIDFDPTGVTKYGVRSLYGTGRGVNGSTSLTNGFIAAANADAYILFTNSDGSNYYQAMLSATWDYGTSGAQDYGNFGTDAAPDEWREVAVGNHNDQGKTADDFTTAKVARHVQFARKLFPGNGMAKNSTVKLTNQYTVQFNAVA